MTTIEILNALAIGELSQAEALALLPETEGSAASGDTITLKVSQKGAISVYGLQRMPVTLYVQQWDRLLAKADAIRAFAKVNASRLSVRKPKAASKPAEYAGVSKLLGVDMADADTYTDDVPESSLAIALM